ncbi:MAG: hypothetical protein J0L80_04605 [Chitinophagales bacterium]|nr:hypothetical protein [Chitinophagales bacterium]
MMTNTKRPKFILISLLMLLLFNYPLLSAANKLLYVGKMPLLFVYIATVWLLTIILLWITSAAKK